MTTRTLSGKTALVTGGARRLGAGIACALHAAGANLLLHYRESVDEANRLCDRLNAARPSSAYTIGQDLVHTARLARLVDAALERTGRLDILVNNASTFYPTPVGAIEEAQWDDLVGTNLKAPLFLSQAAAPALAANHGVIINLLDVHARRPLRGHAVYCAAKAGLAMLTRSLARELGPAVRVNGVAPGTILWPVQAIDERIKAQIIGETSLKRQGTVADVAECVVYLARDAVYVTGETITVDGGRSIGW